jgi:fructosamine-3-kinase
MNQNPIFEKILKRNFPMCTSLNAERVAGGDINKAFRLRFVSEGEQRQVFIKLNASVPFSGLFEKEARGLSFMQEHSSFVIPDVVDYGVVDSEQYLVLEWINGGGDLSAAGYEVAGRKLAEMHKNFGNAFGLSHDNYLATLKQTNTSSDSWSAFYLRQRLLPVLRLAHQRGLLRDVNLTAVEAMEERIEAVFPIEQPSPLHGDLWSGNAMPAHGDKMVLIDPAVYFGHRYMDLTMTKLFGGFPDAFYQGYESVYPLEGDIREAMLLAQLYPILVHVVLFGEGYSSRAREIINHFR